MRSELYILVIFVCIFGFIPACLAYTLNKLGEIRLRKDLDGMNMHNHQLTADSLDKYQRVLASITDLDLPKYEKILSRLAEVESEAKRARLAAETVEEGLSNLNAKMASRERQTKKKEAAILEELPPEFNQLEMPLPSPEFDQPRKKQLQRKFGQRP